MQCLVPQQLFQFCPPFVSLLGKEMSSERFTLKLDELGFLCLVQLVQMRAWQAGGLAVLHDACRNSPAGL